MKNITDVINTFLGTPLYDELIEAVFDEIAPKRGTCHCGADDVPVAEDGRCWLCSNWEPTFFVVLRKKLAR